MNGLSLCSGVGGFELGISLAVPGYRTVCYVEREAHAASVLVARMEDQTLAPAPIWDDLATFDGRPWRGIVDLITAGIPCQPYSVAGRQEGHADERALWPEFVRIVGECRPSLVFIENVPAFAKWFREPGERLCELGYEIESPLFIAAQDVGAPHKRERVFILAQRISDPIGDSLRYLTKRGPGGARPTDAGHAESRDVEQELAHAKGSDGRTKLKPGEPTRDRWPGSSGEREELGHAPGHDQLRHSLPGGHGQGEPVRGSSGELADAQGTGRGGQPQPDLVYDGLQFAHGYPLFPPGPQDLDLWARVLAEAPTLEPALCRVAHEFPQRVDRLRACGNGVVPLVAAVAFLALTDRIRPR